MVSRVESMNGVAGRSQVSQTSCWATNGCLDLRGFRISECLQVVSRGKKTWIYNQYYNIYICIYNYLIFTHTYIYTFAVFTCILH